MLREAPYRTARRIPPPRYRSYTPGMTNCRPHCGACCIAPSITSPIPGMPNGKPAGVPCVNLTDDMRCAIFGWPERPGFCVRLTAGEDMCGADRGQALAGLAALERATRP